MKKSWNLAAGRAGAAVVTCGVLHSARGGGTGRHAAGPDAARPSVPGGGGHRTGHDEPGHHEPVPACQSATGQPAPVIDLFRARRACDVHRRAGDGVRPGVIVHAGAAGRSLGRLR